MITKIAESVRGFFSLRIPNSEFTSRPWRAHEVLDGFRVEDVWALPTPGGPDDLAVLARFAASSENTTLTSNPVIRGLFKLRWQIGEKLGWDDEKQKVGKRVASLRDDMPADLLAVERGPDMALTPFKSVFLTDTEWTSEFSASMGHIVMHHGWVRGEDGKYYSQMTSLVKPYGIFGKMYMASILPFRYLVVYPLQFRAIRKVWPEVLRDWSQPRPETTEPGKS